MEIRVEHAASGETFDHAQLLNPQQHQSRPDVIEKLDSNEQNPERNSVPLRPASKSNAVMSNKHLWISQARSGTVENAVSVPLSHLEANCFPYKSTQSATQNLTA